MAAAQRKPLLEFARPAGLLTLRGWEDAAYSAAPAGAQLVLSGCSLPIEQRTCCTLLEVWKREDTCIAKFHVPLLTFSQNCKMPTKI